MGSDMLRTEADCALRIFCRTAGVLQAQRRGGSVCVVGSLERRQSDGFREVLVRCAKVASRCAGQACIHTSVRCHPAALARICTFAAHLRRCWRPRELRHTPRPACRRSQSHACRVTSHKNQLRRESADVARRHAPPTTHARACRCAPGPTAPPARSFLPSCSPTHAVRPRPLASPAGAPVGATRSQVTLPAGAAGSSPSQSVA